MNRVDEQIHEQIQWMKKAGRTREGYREHYRADSDAIYEADIEQLYRLASEALYPPRKPTSITAYSPTDFEAIWREQAAHVLGEDYFD